MFRASSSATDAFIDLVVQSGGGIAMQWRSTNLGATSSIGTSTSAGKPPEWVKLVRAANTFSGFYSSDGITWTSIGASQTLALPTAAVAGLAVTSHANAKRTIATFTNVAIVTSEQLVFTVQPPTSVAAGATLGANGVQISIENASGTVISADSSTVTLTLSSGTFSTGSNTVTAMAVNGVATFSNLVIPSPGSYTLVASDGTLPSTSSNNFTVTGPTAAKLAFAAQPGTSAVGTAISPAVTVNVETSAGAVVSGNTSTVTLTLHGSTFTGGGTTVSVAAINGVATFSNLTIASAATCYFTATDGSLTSATSNSFTVTGPTPAKLAFATQPSATITGIAVKPAVVVDVESSAGAVSTTDSSTVTLTLHGSTFTGGGTTVSVAAVKGIATFSNLVISTPGAACYFTAADGSLTTDTSTTFAVSGPTPAKLVFGKQPSTSAVGVAISPAVVVDVESSTSAISTSDSSTVTLTLHGSTFAGGGTTASVSAVNGVATFASLVIASSTTCYFTAADGSLTAATSSRFVVNGPVPAQLAFGVQPTNTLAGAAIKPAVVVDVESTSGAVSTTDKSTVTLTIHGGTFASGATTVSVAAVKGVATFSSMVVDTASSGYTFTASDGALTGTTSSAFSVVPAAVSSAMSTVTVSSATAGVGSTVTLTLQAKDTFGDARRPAVWPLFSSLPAPEPAVVQSVPPPITPTEPTPLFSLPPPPAPPGKSLPLSPAKQSPRLRRRLLSVHRRWRRVRTCRSPPPAPPAPPTAQP